MSNPRALSPFQRAGLLVALWLFLLLVTILAFNNLPNLFSHLPGVGVICLGVCGVVVAFSMLAAAIRITLDVASGKYPYD